jgi:hypothetical protein
MQYIGNEWNEILNSRLKPHPQTTQGSAAIAALAAVTPANGIQVVAIEPKTAPDIIGA